MDKADVGGISTYRYIVREALKLPNVASSRELTVTNGGSNITPYSVSNYEELAVSSEDRNKTPCVASSGELKVIRGRGKQ